MFNFVQIQSLKVVLQKLCGVMTFITGFPKVAFPCSAIIFVCFIDSHKNSAFSPPAPSAIRTISHLQINTCASHSAQIAELKAFLFIVQVARKVHEATRANWSFFNLE